MGKNAQRRRGKKLVKQFLRRMASHSPKSQQLSKLSQDYQQEHADVAFNRASRRKAKVKTWTRRK